MKNESRIRVAKVIVLNENDKVLLLRISDWPERPDKSHKPDLPGGEVEVNESSELGVARELLEETGLVAEPAQLVKVYSDVDASRGQVVEREIYLFRCNEPTITLSSEHEEFWWSPIGQLDQVDIKEPYRHVFNLIVRNNLVSLV